MLNILKIGAAIFAVQLLGFYAVVDFLNPGDGQLARVVEALIAAAIAIAAGLLIAVKDSASGRTDHPTILLLALSAAVIHLPREIIPGRWDAIAILLAFLCVFLAAIRERTENESIVVCCFVGIPGIGTPIGGTILFYQWLRRRYRVSAT